MLHWDRRLLKAKATSAHKPEARQDEEATQVISIFNRSIFLHFQKKNWSQVQMKT